MAFEDAAATFNPLRQKLVRVAYQMLGSMADAEDIAQEAFIRWNKADRGMVREPEGFLRRVVTRLCLDHLKSAKQRRETYVGAWLPEPVVEAVKDEVDDVTLPLMLALERLSPLERATFLLHDVFGAGYDEIAETIGREPAACRQLARRAREHVRSARPRFPVTEERGFEIATAFFAASRTGNTERLRSLLREDAVVHSDGGGRASSLPGPVVGLEAAIGLFEALAPVFAGAMSQLIRYAYVNGLPGFVTLEGEQTLQTTALEIDDGRIAGIYVVRNPDKLRHLGLMAQS